jgi:hypothetical protein
MCDFHAKLTAGLAPRLWSAEGKVAVEQRWSYTTDPIQHRDLHRRLISAAVNVVIQRAGAGVVDQSIVVNELEEVNNKLRALKSAIKLAEEI